MKKKDDIHQRLDEICNKGEEITGKIGRLTSQNLEEKLRLMEELEINLNELLDYVREWNENKKAEDT